jgi:putative multiple sugar transport system ATP-binding protein
MNVLSGTYPHGTYTGQIVFEGRERAFQEIADSEKRGIVIIHQKLALIPNLSIGAVAFEVKDWNAYSSLDPDRKMSRTSA